MSKKSNPLIKDIKKPTKKESELILIKFKEDSLKGLEQTYSEYMDAYTEYCFKPSLVIATLRTGKGYVDNLSKLGFTSFLRGLVPFNDPAAKNKRQEEIRRLDADIKYWNARIKLVKEKINDLDLDSKKKIVEAYFKNQKFWRDTSTQLWAKEDRDKKSKLGAD